MAWPAKPLALTKCEALTCDKYTPFDRFIRYRFRSSGPSRQHAKPQCFSDRSRLDQRLYFRSATPSRVRRSSREFVPREVFDNLMTKTNTVMSCFRVFGLFRGSSELKRDNDDKTTHRGASKSAKSQPCCAKNHPNRDRQETQKRCRHHNDPSGLDVLLVKPCHDDRKGRRWHRRLDQ